MLTRILAEISRAETSTQPIKDTVGARQESSEYEKKTASVGLVDHVEGDVESRA